MPPLTLNHHGKSINWAIFNSIYYLLTFFYERRSIVCAFRSRTKEDNQEYRAQDQGNYVTICITNPKGE